MTQAQPAAASAGMTFAGIWEQVAATVPNRTALIDTRAHRTWQQYDDRAARLAAAFAAAGLGADSKVGIYLHNCNEYLETQFGVFKIGGCPINVNYRYKTDELVYLLENSDAEALVFQSSYAMRIWEVAARLPNIKLFVQVEDGSAEVLLDLAQDYERLIREHAPRPQAASPNSDYMLYTGGTTGMPKGVVYDQTMFCSAMLAIGAQGRELPVPQNLAQVPDLIRAVQAPPISLPACPLMHGTGMWLGAMVPLAVGGTVVTSPKLGLDPHRLWDLAATHRVTDLVIVGDAFARPLLQALEETRERGAPYPLSDLKQICSSGVMWSQAVKEGLLEHLDVALVDIMGSSEGGMGSSVTTRELVGNAAPATAQFALNEGVKVFAEDDTEVAPGSGAMGKVATSGLVPKGYYKDPDKSAATFRTIDGVRYSFPGDFATVEADGQITLLGRGSVCINTAGEKVFPEEVEEAVKACPGVLDALVVGRPDERFGERVEAVVAGRDVDSDSLMAFVEQRLAGYKLPRRLHWVDQVQRAPNGKADYKWARRIAENADPGSN